MLRPTILSSKWNFIWLNCQISKQQTNPADVGYLELNVIVNKEVYNRHATAKQPTETVGTSQIAEQSGTQAKTSMNAPTTSFFVNVLIKEASNRPATVTQPTTTGEVTPTAAH